MNVLFTEPQERSVLNAVLCALIGMAVMGIGLWFFYPALSGDEFPVDMQAVIVAVLLAAFVSSRAFEQAARWWHPHPKKSLRRHHGHP
ncbi:MAG: hypothetical protein U0487_01740 [Patescibacteria group bacterium]